MYTYNIYRDGKLEKQFTNQENDFTALRWLQRNQSHSFNWACRYEGWKIEVINEETQEKEIIKPS